MIDEFMDYQDEDEDELIYGEQDEFDDEVNNAENGNAENITEEVYYDSAEDALYGSLDRKGRIDFDFMSRTSSLTKEEILKELEYKNIWLDPIKYRNSKDFWNSWVTKEKLLSGNLHEKIEAADELEDNLFAPVTDLLISNLPANPGIENIYLSMGAPFIPKDIVEKFIAWLYELPSTLQIHENKYEGEWCLINAYRPNPIKNEYTYGTKRMHGLEIVEHILNAKTIRIYDVIERADKNYPDKILNSAETLAAQEKAKNIENQFERFVLNSKGLCQRIEEAHGKYFAYNCVKYDGSYLKLKDLNPEVKPYPHQKNAAVRCIMNKCTLLAHDVGAGKTLEFSAAVHEIIRLKIGKKALICVPNATFTSTVQMYKHYFPNDKVLAVYPRTTFAPANRTKTIELIKSGEYPVIFMAFSSFDMISLSKEAQLEFMDEDLARIKSISETSTSYEERRHLRNLYSKQKEKRNEFAENFEKNSSKLELCCFDKLGIDTFVLDECHNYKNISIDNAPENVIGFRRFGSNKADNMLKKVDYVRRYGRRIIFSTGTPITNSLADLYTIERYLQYEDMMFMGIDHFNSWANTFTEQTSNFEIDVDSQNFRFMTRFSHFHNLPELMGIVSQVIDSFQIDKSLLGLPDYEKKEIVIKRTAAQEQYILDLVKRTEDIRKKRVNPLIKNDNLLLITIDGRMCALDIRLVMPELIGKEISYDDNSCKVKACAAQIKQLYEDYPDTTQIAFCDLGTPKANFNIYDELKNELIQRGIKESHIAFIHDATSERQRTALEKRFNEGKIRVLVGSTVKLGVGVNVQDKLIAVHHIDIPWRPADMVQREGRIIRQGNLNSKVFIYRYVTESSFDSYSWQLLENKQRFISEFLSSSLNASHRDEKDCSDAVLDYAEIKALAIGNPLIKERVEVSNDLEHAIINQRHKAKELLALLELAETFPDKIRHENEIIEILSKDRDFYSNHKPVTKQKRQEFGQEVMKLLAYNKMADEEEVIGDYQGFQVVLPKNMKAEKPYIILARHSRYQVDMTDAKPIGCTMRMDNALDGINKMIENHEGIKKSLYSQWNQAKIDINKGNEFDDEVEHLKRELDKIDRALQEAREGQKEG